MSEAPSPARTCRYEEIPVGMQEQFDYLISPDIYKYFLGAFDDRSPIHVDEDYAKAHGFSGKVMHGTLLNGFLSHFVGMHFPGKLSFLLAVDLRYSQPCYLGDSIRLQAKVSQKMDARRIIVLDLSFDNLTRGIRAASGRAQVMVKEE